jgi:hypothetical protein
MRARARLRGDDGATLVVALIFITVVALGLAVTLSFADTSLRATRALRDQAAGVANADGAAQVAINALRKGTYNGTAGSCFGGSSALTLPNFYQPPSGPADSAFVSCALDTDHTLTDPNVTINDDNMPNYAILTVGTNSFEDGINVRVAGGGTLKVKGPIFSNSTIDVDLGTLNSSSSVTARRGCSGPITSTPSPVCNIGPGSDRDPDYSPNGGSTTLRSVPNCKKNDLIHLSPGRYTDLSGLNKITSSVCKDTVLHFEPGTYYLDLDGQWNIASGWVVGGKATTNLVAGTAPPIPGACESPTPPTPIGTWTKQTPGQGVQIIFGGESRIAIGHAKVELCGIYSTARPPIALYGLKSPVDMVDAQGGCVTDTSFGCPVITTDNAPDSLLFVQGTTYMPRARIAVALNNDTGQVFRNGVIARSLYVEPTASADLSNPLIEVLGHVTDFGRRTVVYLTVHVCPGASTCSAAGRLRLRVKVGIIDPSGSPGTGGDRDVTVYTWSVQR